MVYSKIVWYSAKFQGTNIFLKFVSDFKGYTSLFQDIVVKNNKVYIVDKKSLNLLTDIKPM